MSRFLIVGLGNPTEKYKMTRHNLGFGFADKILKLSAKGETELKFKKQVRLKSETARVQFEGVEIILAKPQTYMNLSGEAAKKLLKFYDLEASQMIVIGDDFNLKLGQARLRFSGASGGHNGISSIIESIGNDFWRLRIGIGLPQNVTPDKFVLEKFKPDEQKAIQAIIDKSAEVLLNLIPKDRLENKTINL